MPLFRVTPTLSVNKETIGHIEFFQNGDPQNGGGRPGSRPELVISFVNPERSWVRVSGEEAEKGWKNYLSGVADFNYDEYGESKKHLDELKKTGL